MFTDKNFVSRLYSGNRGLFQKIFDEVKYLCRVATAGSKQARQLEKIKHTFEEVYKEGAKAQKNTAKEDGDVRWSISSNLSSDIDSVLDGTFDASNNEVYLGKTSNFLTDVIGAKSISLYMSAAKAYSSIVTKEEYDKNPYYAKQRNYHGIGKEDFIEILEKSENPIAAFADRADEKGNKRQNRIVLVTDKLLTDKQTGKPGYAVVVEEVDSAALKNGKRIKANKTITVFPRTQLNLDIIEAIADGRILDITKKGEQLLAGVRGANAQAAIQETVLKKNIANFWANVKWEKGKNKTASSTGLSGFSTMKDALQKAGYIDQNGHIQNMQKNRKNSLSAKNENTTPIKDGIYGKDVLLDDLPIRQMVSKAETVDDVVGDIPIRSDIKPNKSTAESANGIDDLPIRSDLAKKEYITIEEFANREASVWNNVEYSDEATKNKIMQETHDSMVAEGSIVNVSDDTLDNVSQSFPDLRSMKKKERTQLIKESINKLKNNLRQFLGGFKNQGFEFEVNGKVLDAKLYSTGIDEVLEKITQDKANMLYTTEEIFKNARYLYSTPDYDSDSNVYRWNYFYTPVQIGEETVGVRIAVRDLAKQGESQIYHWGIKKDASLDGVRDDLENRKSHDVSSDASIDIIPETEPKVNTDMDDLPIRKDIAQSNEGTNTNAISRPLNSYPAEKQKVIRSYIRAVDKQIKDFVERVKNGDLRFERKKISDVSQRAAADIKKLLDIDVTGYTNNINTSGVQHIIVRHGANGKQDTTMSFDDDIARVGWVLENYDSVELLTENGEQVYSSSFMDKNNNPAAQVRYIKKIDGTYYVVETVFENDYKKIWVQSTYLQKNEDVTQASAEGNKTDHGANAQSALVSPSSNDSISDIVPVVNTDTDDLPIADKWNKEQNKQQRKWVKTSTESDIVNGEKEKHYEKQTFVCFYFFVINFFVLE